MWVRRCGGYECFRVAREYWAQVSSLKAWASHKPRDCRASSSSPDLTTDSWDFNVGAAGGGSSSSNIAFRSDAMAAKSGSKILGTVKLREITNGVYYNSHSFPLFFASIFEASSNHLENLARVDPKNRTERRAGPRALSSSPHFLRLPRIMDQGHGLRSCGHLSTTPWARRFARATVRLTLPIQIFSICTHPRVVQRCVHRDALRRAALFRGRCGKVGAVETQAPYSGPPHVPFFLPAAPSTKHQLLHLSMSA
jgi:hypothetical protein